MKRLTTYLCVAVGLKGMVSVSAIVNPAQVMAASSLGISNTGRRRDEPPARFQQFVDPLECLRQVFQEMQDAKSEDNIKRFFLEAPLKNGRLCEIDVLDLPLHGVPFRRRHHLGRYINALNLAHVTGKFKGFYPGRAAEIQHQVVGVQVFSSIGNVPGV